VSQILIPFNGHQLDNLIAELSERPHWKVNAMLAHIKAVVEAHNAKAAPQEKENDSAV
jgi:hypothetical protein